MNNYNSLSSRFGTWLKNGIGDSGGSPPTSRSKTSWLVMLLLLLSVSLGHRTWAQSTANYAYSTSTTGSLALDKDGNAVDMSTGTTQLYGAGVDTYTNAGVQNFGFTFRFMGSAYTQWNANPDGQIRLGTTLLTGHTSSAASGAPFIIASNIDAITGAAGKVHYKVQAGTGGQVLIVEWKDVKLNWNATGTTLSTFQTRLYENGTIEYVYGSMFNSSTSSQSQSIGFSSSNTAGTIASLSTINTTPTNTTNGTSFASTSFAASAAMANLNSAADGSRRVFRWVPNTTVSGDVTTLTFSAITATTTTVNFVDNATNEVGFLVTRATDAAFTQNVVNTAVATTTSAGTGTAYNSVQSAITPGTTYYYKVVALVEAGVSTGITGSQATNAATTYYWTGASGGTWSTGANWNTAADGTGTARTTAATTDILIVDGAGTTAGGTMSITLDNNFSIGQLKVTSNTALTMVGLGANRTLTITGSPGDDFVVESGSTLTFNGGTGLAVAIAFSGTGNTGLIAGTYNTSGSNTSNTITTTGGTSTLVTVSGTVNNSILGASGCLTGSVATLSFTSTANYTHSAFTTTSGYVPLATWDTASNVFITGGTTGTGVTNASGQSFGNFTYNSTTNAAATMSVFTSGTTIIKGNLNVIATGTGRFRALTSGTLTVQGNLSFSAGIFEVSSSAGTLIVNGNVSIGGGTFDLAQSGATTLRVLGNFVQTAGTIIQTSTTGLLDFAGTVAQNLTVLSGAHGTNAVNVRVNNAAGVNLTADMSIRNLTVTNGNVTGTGVLSYGASSLLTYNSTTGAQTITAAEFPATNGPASLTINNTATSPNNTVTLSSARSLGASGVLTLTSGFLVNGANTLTIANTAVGGISGGSTTAHVKGALARTLPSGLVSGSTYNFPVGVSGYNPFALVNPTTNAGASVVVKTTVSDSGTSGTATGLLSTLNTNRSWLVEVTDAGGNFTGSLVRLTDTPGTANAVGFSADGGLTYALLGGTNATVTGTDITTTAPAATSVNGYFVMGTKADPPVLSALNVTPTGNLCTNATRNVTITVTPGAAALTSVVINYSINGVAQTAVAMTNTSGTSWAGTIPTVTPANATVAWSVTATDANGISATQAGTSYKDEPNFGATATASLSTSTVCLNGSSTLSLVTNLDSVTLGAGATNSSSTAASFFPGAWGGAKTQYIVRASELTAAGLGAGPITSLGFEVTAVGQTYQGFRVQLGHTTATAMTTTFLTDALTQVYLGTLANDGYLPTVGVNTLAFGTGTGSSSSFVWDGTSNILVNICWSSVPSATTSSSSTMKVDAPGFTCSVYEQSDSLTPADMCAKTVGDGTGTSRPRFIFGKAPYTISWSDGSTEVGTTKSLVVTPTTSTTYTATLTANGCPAVTSNAVTLTVNPLPTAPTASNSSQCGTQVPTASVADPNGFTSPTFKWYADNVTTTALQNSTSSTYTTAVASTTTFYVSVVNPTTLCESSRTAVTVTVATPEAITMTPSSGTVCQNGTIALGASSVAGYTYTWTASPEAGSGITNASPLTGSSVNVTPTGTGPYTYTATGVEGSCTATNTVTVTITPAPVLTISASNSAVCPGGSAILTAQTSVVSAGIATIGTGTTLTGATTQPTAFCNRWPSYRMQIVYTAAELAAAGLSAGNITSMAFNVNSLGDSADNANFVVKIGATTSSTLSGNFVDTTSYTTVFPSATYTHTASGWQTIPFSTPYAWDGTSNIIVEMIHSGADLTNNAQTYYTATAGNTVAYTTTASTNAASFSTQRLNVQFGGQIQTTGVGSLAYSWNDPSSTTGNVVTVNPTTTTTYTVAGFDSVTGCTGYKTTTVTVNAPPSAPTATNASQCGAGVPTASVADTNGFASPIYKWYADNVTTTALQSGASATYTSSISATTTFYVSVTSATAGCESERTAVTVTVNTPATISASSDVAAVCTGGSATLTAAALTGTVNSYAWTPSATLSASTGDSVVATPTATTTYSVVGTDSNNCTTAAATVTVTVNAYPSAVAIAQSPLTLCAGSVATLTASGGTISTSGTGTIGTATTLTGATTQPTAFCNRWPSYRMQMVYTAAELTAAGLSAGTITSMAFNITTLGDGATNDNFEVKIGNTSLSVLSGDFVSTASGFTTVFPAATYTHTASGLQTIPFSTPFVWDGTSNIIVEMIHNGADLTNNSQTYYTATTGNTVAYTTTASTNAASFSTNRLNTTFGYTASVPTSLIWSPQTNLFTDAAATVAYTGDSRAVVYTNTSSEQTYTVTASNGTCSVTDDVTVTPNPLPSFTASDITICKGETGSLSAVSGESNTYSWTPVGGGTTLTGVNVSVSPLVTTTYNVVATSNITACQSSQEVTVTVSDPGQIISGTTERTVSPDVPTTFEVVTAGTGLTYQWQVNDGSGWVDLTDDYVDAETGNYSGVNTAILTVDNITLDFNGYLYQCIVTGASPCVSLEPVEATLNVSDTGFLTQPSNVTVCGTSTAEFTIVTSGDEPFNVQWQVSTDGGATFQDIVDGPDATIVGLDFTGANATSPKTLLVSGITTDHDGYQFLCQLNFGLNSTIATLDVKTPVAITTQPQATQTVCYSGGTTSFTAAASGDFSSVQWQYSADGSTGWANVVNGTPVGATYANATTTTLGITTTAATTSGYYRANFVGSTPCTNLATEAGQLLINTPNVSINASSTAFCLPSGNAITLTASGASTYTWSPATGLSATTGAVVFCSPSATTTYTVTGDDGTGCLDTAQVTITVGSDLTATATASPTTVCSGSNSQLDVAVTEVNATPFAQKYAFQATTGTYTPVSGSATQLTSVQADTAISAAQNIGFNFVYDGNTYTQFKMSSNGFISLNMSGTSSLGTNNLSTANATSRPIIAPLWDDTDGSATGGSYAGYEVTGTAPNRVLTVEWRNWEWIWSSTNPVISYQVKLYEGTNVIEYIYRSESGAVSSGSATIGIGSATGSGAGSYINLSSITTPAVSSTTSTTSLSTKPATGTVYRFTPTQTFTYSWSPSTFIEGQTNLKSPMATGINAPVTYSVTVTNAAGCSTTASAPAITLEGGPVITAQPSPLVVTKCQGEAASFSVTATGPTLSYQWRKDGQPITGNASATTATLNLTGTTPADSGSYDVVITACAVSVTSDAVALTVYPTPTITTTLSSASYCAGATVPGISLAGTPSGVTFDVTGGSAVGLSDQTAVTSIPSFTATAGTATITVTPKANGCSGTAVTYTITVNALPTALSVSPTSQTICSNATPVLLTATGGIDNASVVVGTGTTLNSTTGYPAPLSNYYGGAKHQMLIRASELTALGFAAGDKIKGIAFDVSTVGSTYTGSLSDFTVAIGNTTNTTLTSTAFVGGLTTVRNAATLTVPTTSLPQNLNIPFDTNFTWNGTSNIVIQTSYSNGNTGASTDFVQSKGSTTAFSSTNWYRADGATAASILSASTPSGSGSTRPNFVLTREGNSAITWSPTTGLYTDAAGTVPYTGTATATVYARPTTSTNYVARATTFAGCYVDASASSFTVNPAPTVTASYACSGTSFTANAVPGGAGSYTYAWTVPVGFTNPGDVASFVSSTPGTYSVVITNTVTGCSSSSSSFTVTFGTLYQDADGDGYGNAAVSIVGCSQSGYVSNSTDCDDTIFAVNPGVVEILYNGVDDNCNGVMDEGYQITANMVNCGTTLSTISSFIYCVSTPGVNGYRFEVTNTTTNQVQTIDKLTQFFSLTELSSYDYATTYSVRVMVRKSSNNVWLGYYGPACLYSTPPVIAPAGGAGTTQLQTYCGETLPTISTIISTTSLPGATGYRFRVTNTTTGAVQTLTRTIHWFSLTMLSSYNYGTTYAVDVAVKTTGDYSDYGAPCTVTTPAVPTLANYCGGAIVPTKGTQIRTSSLDKVTAYEFTVDRYNESLELVSSSVVVKSLNRFTFNDITNYAPSTTYSVRVRVFTAGSWSPYGDACEIVSPGAARQGETKAVDSSLFSVVAYPNPYDYQFSFRMESSSDAPVNIKVYDMIGKLIETREVNAADMPVVSLGERYPSGVYNVVVTQEENVKTLRLVKR